MTEEVIKGLIDEASARWDVRKARVIHRVGQLALQDQIVFVGVCSAHRSDAFAGLPVSDGRPEDLGAVLEERDHGPRGSTGWSRRRPM